MLKEKPKGVRLRNLTKLYRDPKTRKEFAAVDNITVDIPPGSFVTLLGPSGCGKTTTLRMIAGFESPEFGEIFIGDQGVNSLAPNQRDTAMVFQSYALLPHYNVYDNVSYGLKVRKMTKDEIREKVQAMLELVELTGLEERMPNQLSGGQQQRVALARALVMNPGVLLFDEPLSNLDAKLRISMRTEIRRIQTKLGLTAIYVTHDQAEAMSLSDSIILMDRGRIAQIGTPQDLYYRPNSEFTAGFIGEANFLKARVEEVAEDRVRVIFNGVPLEVRSFEDVRTGGDCKIVIRPESVTLHDRGEIPCRVLISTFMGSYQYYQVVSGEETIIVTDYNPRSRRIFRAEEEAFLTFDNSSLHVL